MKTIKLSGRLGKNFGKEFKLDIASPAEGIRALCTLLPEFEEELKKGQYRVYRLYDEEERQVGDEEELQMHFGKATGFKIVPVAAGAKKGLGKLILGVALIGTAFVAAPMAFGMKAGSASAASLTIGGVSAAKVGAFGGLMALQGASMLLTPTPQTPQTADQKESFLLDGTGNLLEQGNPVPVVFGRAFVGSVVVSAGISSDETAFTNE